MDRFVRTFPARRNKDLMIAERHGVAWQKRMRPACRYDYDYFDSYRRLAGTPIALALNDWRCRFVGRHIGDAPLLDIGVGSGEFIRTRDAPTFGYDVNRVANAWLRHEGIWSDRLPWFGAFTFWDVLEHVVEPECYFRQMAGPVFVFCCLPIFDDLGAVRRSKHYKPGEHLYYWTEAGFVRWMAMHGFVLVERSDAETQLGREAIVSFAFRRTGTVH